jgi:hypothetical protein
MLQQTVAIDSVGDESKAEVNTETARIGWSSKGKLEVAPGSHPQLNLMLQQTVAIDSVDDESKAEVC